MTTANTLSIRDMLVRKEVLGLEVLRPLLPKLTSPEFHETDPTAASWLRDMDINNVAYTAARLYLLEHPLNPCHGDKDVLAFSFALMDACCDQLDRRGRKLMRVSEWSLYIISQILGMVPARKIGRTRRARWAETLSHWCEQMLHTSSTFTSPNIEAWKCMALYASGEFLDRADFREAALFQQRQELTYQTPEGFWEEGRHHGPSLKYNYMQLQAMTRLATMSGDVEIRAGARRLAEFMAEFHFPDGSTMGCLDGRQSYALGPWLAVVPGQDLTAPMREIARRSVATQDRYGCFSEPKYFASSTWYATHGMAMLTEGSRFFQEVDETPTALPLDAEGAVVQRHSPYMEGGAIRRGGFVAACSGIISTIPKETGDRFRLQRQNRIDLWHEKTGLLIGGGHGAHAQNPPFANVVMDTGFHGQTDFGLLQPELWYRQLSYICPVAAATSFEDGQARLDLHFRHGSVSFTISFPAADKVEIRYDYRTQGVEKLCVQLLPVLFRDSTMRIDEESVDPCQPKVHPVASCLEVTNTILGGTYRIERVAGEGEMRLRTPLDPLRGYYRLLDAEPFDSVYKQALLCVQIPQAEPTGSGRFRVTVT